MSYEKIAEFVFPSSDAAYNAMKAIDQFEPWDTARQYAAYGYYLTITSAIKNPEKVMAVINMYGGKPI